MNSKKTMLIVDDKRVNRFTLSCIFEKDFEISECVNGREAIDFLKENTPDIILLDLVMPECDGFEVINFVRQLNMNQIPIVLISASNDEEERKKAFKLQIADFIHKPFDEQVVRERVMYALDRYRSR